MSKPFCFKEKNVCDSSTEANIFIHGYSAGHNDDDQKKLLDSISDDILCGYTNIFAFWDSGHFSRFSPDSCLLIGGLARMHWAFVPVATMYDRAGHFLDVRAQAEVMGKILLSQLYVFLHKKYPAIKTINLIGHSLGGRLVVHCLKNLTHNPHPHLSINDVLLMAAAVEVEPSEAQSMRGLIDGRLFNAYSTDDRILWLPVDEKSLGRRPVDNFDNVKIDGFGHSDYWPNLFEVLAKTIHKRPNQLVVRSDKNYSEERFWEKLKKFFSIAGQEVVDNALQLYYAAREPGVSTGTKASIYSALGYFIMPLDVIPDVTPVLGFSDDLGVLMAVVSVVSNYINEEVRQKSTRKISKWFG